MTLSGALRFGRYSFPPNRLGYCGPPDHQALLEYVSSGHADPGLIDLERRFEGAYPYLVLIAEANGIPDPFDDRVVEAYWVGNDCLDRVGASPLYQLLEERFKPKMATKDFGWLTGKLDQGAHPHHNFHVFDVYCRAGLMRGARADIALATMDSCRVSWGRVTAVTGEELVVDRQPLVWTDGRLGLGEAVPVNVTRQYGQRGFVDGAQPGDEVAVHWDWACEVLPPTALGRLQVLTRKYLALANQTL